MARGLPKGKTNNPNGRPKGALSETTKQWHTMRDCVIAAFFELQNDPSANVISWGKANPTAFYAIASKLFPIEIQQQISISTTPINKWIDSETINIDDANTEQQIQAPLPGEE